MSTPTRLLAALSLCTLGLGACVAESEPDLDTPRGALLYDLSEAEVLDIHARYGGDEDLELFRERLVAPFDCALYDQFCDQVGETAAYEITGEMIDFALDEAPLEDIEAHFDTRVDEVLEAGVVEEDEGFRGSTAWTIRSSGSYRMRVRNGISTPVIGKRKAWTEANTQKKGLFGTWSNSTAANLCVNTGTNTQVRASSIYVPYMQTEYTTIETRNPPSICNNVKTLKVQTEHTRHVAGPDGDGGYDSYRIYANGCANASIGGVNFSACAPEHTQSF